MFIAGSGFQPGREWLIRNTRRTTKLNMLGIMSMAPSHSFTRPSTSHIESSASPHQPMLPPDGQSLSKALVSLRPKPTTVSRRGCPCVKPISTAARRWAGPTAPNTVSATFSYLLARFHCWATRKAQCFRFQMCRPHLHTDLVDPHGTVAPHRQLGCDRINISQMASDGPYFLLA